MDEDNDDHDETDSNSNSIMVEGYTFLSDLDQLNRLLILFNVWIGHNEGEVVPIHDASSNLIILIQSFTIEKWIDTIINFKDNNDNNDEDAKSKYIYCNIM